jgi:hypothetical protein
VPDRSKVILVCVLAVSFSALGQASARTFGGYDCIDDCIGHAAGYRWAEERGIENIDDCPENSPKLFTKGVSPTWMIPSAAPILTTTAN